MIHPLMSGFNGCVFAYGATGTGKTHTMLGNAVTSGLCNLALKDIYYTSTDQEFADQQFSIRVCYVEIYNEMIRDLLDAQKSNKYLDLRDDPTKGVEIAGVSEIEVKNEREVGKSLHRSSTCCIRETSGELPKLLMRTKRAAGLMLSSKC